MKTLLTALSLSAAILFAQAAAAAPMPALIVDGQNNHDWAGTTPLLKKYLEETGLFTVEVATTPPSKGDLSGFKPEFKKYKLVVSNYNGDPWSDETKKEFADYVRSGGGFVSVHAADNSFPEWKEYNEMIGVGGWGGRNEKFGPKTYWDEGESKLVRDGSAGPGGHHGSQHDFLVVTREPKHPIMAGLPEKWLHVKDELYDQLRGPAENMTVLATAYSDPKQSGTGHNEPMLMTIKFGQGRVFHTAMGHSSKGAAPAMQCVGFIATFQRGAEWAATGKVTQKVPADFPTETKTSKRE